MVEKYCDGVFPKGNNEWLFQLRLGAYRKESSRFARSTEQYQFTRVLEEIWRLISDVDC